MEKGDMIKFLVMMTVFVVTLIWTCVVQGECLVEKIPTSDGESAYVVPVATCRTTDCAKRYFFANIRHSQKTNTFYYGTKILVGAGQCLRVNILDPDNTLAAMLMCPDTEPVYKEESPLIVHSTKESWCRLLVHTTGGIEKNKAFHYNVSRYKINNINCLTGE